VLMEEKIIQLYKELIEAWNSRDAEAMSVLFTTEGEIIGFDGSLSKGPKEILSHLQPIFENHPTPPFVTKIINVRFLAEEVVMLRAIAGMRPIGESDINPKLNTHHTLLASKNKEGWKIELFQNTPAQFHGRPELVEQMTDELRSII
jgi:uncharacterized protein (TIGR02246 family)